MMRLFSNSKNRCEDRANGSSKLESFVTIEEILLRKDLLREWLLALDMDADG
jgi:hypothetical protein